MMFSHTLRCGFFALVVMLAPAVTWAQDGAIDASAIASTITSSSKEKLQTLEALNKRLRERLSKLAEEINKTEILAFDKEIIRRMGTPPIFPWLTNVQELYVSSNATSEEVEKELDLVNLQTVLGYATVEGSRTLPSKQAGGTIDTGMFAQGVLTGAADIYDAHMKLFCFPEMRNAPPECGAAREAAGVRSDDTIVDFFLSPKTWERRTVIDGVRLAQAYFGIGTDRESFGDLEVSGASLVPKLARIARSNLRIAILNDLASRRAMTSAATSSIVGKMLEILSIGGTVSIPDYKVACLRPPGDLSAEERYACDFTNKPDNPTGDRVISQAAMDRLIEFDLSMSSELYNEIQSPTVMANGALDKIQVALKARQLAQDYRQLRLLQMKVAAEAMDVMDGLAPGSRRGTSLASR